MDSPEHRRRFVREYFETQVDDEEITHLERVASERVMGTEYDVWDVHTDNGRWWVISNPMNLYTQDHLKSMDVALSFHIGLTMRVMSRHPRPRAPHGDRLAASRRRLAEASEALDDADEAEELQAVGMRCRECLLTFVREVAATEALAQVEAPALKTGDFKGWAELLANTIAAGSSAAHRRSYLKAVAHETWEYVSWLTHAQNATRPDAQMAVAFTDHIISSFAIALARFEQGEPERCPACSSYRLISDFRGWQDEGDDSFDIYVTLCEACAWEDEPELRRIERHEPESGDAPPPPPESDCVSSADIQTFMTPEDFVRRHEN